MVLAGRKSLCIVLLLSFLVALAGCQKTPPQPPVNTGQGQAYPLSVKDDADRLVTLEEKPDTIVSLSPSHTEILFALDLNDRIVGVTDYCDYPQAALAKSKIGGFSTPSIEKIIGLQPDLVLAGDMHHQVVTALEAAHVKVLVFCPNTMEEIFSTISQIGQAVGEEEAASRLLAGLQQRVDVITEKVAQFQGPKPQVFYEVWHEPLMSAADNTLIGELIRLSGGVNIIGSSRDLYPKISEEVILEKNPQVMIHSYGHGSSETLSAETVGQRKGWEHLSFVQNGRIASLEANLIDRAGPRIVDGLEAVAQAIHPELFI